MDAKEIISRLAKTHTIEGIITNIYGTMGDDERDLAQDLYVDLLNKDPKLIEKMDADGSIKFFLTRMVLNNLQSVNSPYYYRYKKTNLNKVSIDSVKDKI